ncbi:TetR/AcrR family transcriptional regulator [Streptomyces sp. Je 1-4]|uniref:TetR/AcrR family transcriptional regulator n=1 Tax=Streptomyces TaxID=1883 RepID=UPI00140E98FF|nr:MULTISPECIES: TetR/AcrR family transcriptional regulator [unclassified Streptomyces]QIK10073.1 TetR/AcrR family transcriptional regulator [Streptomyces sp. ID38640]UYB43824.1 TetR/AcrR family transcriptional regulator [Streptomyces sp. Je 1-4]UZQ40237.1 TetR/AcrR family transcriptional regulator [Streptomyces sp. Je 1-4] [Streptomyces sp. Je 1-4 4N24]UZQ47654.1 TetR/AcrR family transcriptional regulator [Streptomyces sp. Je 1-4] [Streptomyces sp. Je 1-4 4N24_ara]
MSGKRTTRLTPDQRREQLVGIGLEMLADRSLDELSTDEVARRAGISRGLLFHYFDSKRDFYRAVVRAACDRFTAATEPDGTLEPVAWMRAFIAGFVVYVLEHRQVYLALVRGAAGSHPAVTDIVGATRETLARRVRDGQRRLGMPDAPRLELASRAWMAFAEEAVVNWPAEEPGAQDELCAFIESSFVSLLGLLDRPGVLTPR